MSLFCIFSVSTLRDFGAKRSISAVVLLMNHLIHSLYLILCFQQGKIACMAFLRAHLDQHKLAERVKEEEEDPESENMHAEKRRRILSKYYSLRRRSTANSKKIRTREKKISKTLPPKFQKFSPRSRQQSIRGSGSRRQSIVTPRSSRKHSVVGPGSRKQSIAGPGSRKQSIAGPGSRKQSIVGNELKKHPSIVEELGLQSILDEYGQKQGYSFTSNTWL